MSSLLSLLSKLCFRLGNTNTRKLIEMYLSQKNEENLCLHVSYVYKTGDETQFIDNGLNFPFLFYSHLSASKEILQVQITLWPSFVCRK